MPSPQLLKQRKNFPHNNPFISRKRMIVYDLFTATSAMTHPMMNIINHDTSPRLIHKSPSSSSASPLLPHLQHPRAETTSMFASFFLQLCAFPVLTTWTCQRLRLPSQFGLTVTSFLRHSGLLLILALVILHLPLSSCFRLRKSADLQVPRWIDPCKARPFTSIRDFAGVPMTDDQEQEVFDAVIAATRMANTHAERIKFKFIKTVMRADPDVFEKGVADWRQDWLPVIPQFSDQLFEKDKMSTDEAFKKTFQFLQYFAVGVEQILMDIILHDGKMWSDMKRVENQLYQIICEVRLGMYLRGIEPDRDVMHSAMSHEFRDIDNASRRNTRDYLILRDYIRAVQFIMEMFRHLKLQRMNQPKL